MSDKQRVLDALQRMPETATLEEISEQIAILAAIRRGEEEADSGRFTSIWHSARREPRFPQGE